MNNSESIIKEEVVEVPMNYYLKFDRSPFDKGNPYFVWLSITKEAYLELKHFIERSDTHELLVTNHTINLWGRLTDVPILTHNESVQEIIDTNKLLPKSNVVVNTPLGHKDIKIEDVPIEESIEDYKLRVKDAIDNIILNETYYTDRPGELQLLLKSLTIKKLV